MSRLAKLIPFLILLAFAASCSTANYFPDRVLSAAPEQQMTTDRYRLNLIKLREPSLWRLSQENSHAEQYRVLVLSGITPIHSIRLIAEPDGNGMVFVKKLSLGDRMKGRNSIDFKKDRKISQQQVSAFRTRLADVNFWNAEIQDVAASSGAKICVHPTIFLFEATKNGNYKFLHESVCRFTEITTTLLPAFYELGGIGPETRDWSLVEYFDGSEKR